MKVYKEKQYLVFEFNDGKTCKYDFATKIAYGKSGKRVKNLKTQLANISINDMCDYCEDPNYGRFLRFVARNASYGGGSLYNIGTVLSRVPRFAHYEQIFSAGFDDVVCSDFQYTIKDIPKGLVSLCRDHRIKLDNEFLKFYKEIPDAYQIAYKLEYSSLTDNDIYDVMRKNRWTGRECRPYFNDLILNYGYNAKALMLYIDHLKTFEAIDDMRHLIAEIYDYATMMRAISPKYDRFPRHFLTTHKIAARNYNRLKIEYDEAEFAKHINPGMEKTFGNYCFIYPKTTQEIKDEAVQQNNCVSSYVGRVLKGQCDILFLRLKDHPDKSLVTIEVRRGQIIQALQRFNHPLTDEQRSVVSRWNEWYARKLKEKAKENVA